MTIRRRTFAGFAGAMLIGNNVSAQAAFPQRPVTITVPVGPGGGTDLLARQLGKSLSEIWGQPVVVDNKTGAAGIIGAQAVIKTPGDGHSLLLSHDGVFIATPVLFKRPDFEPQKQLAPISQVATQPYAAVVHPSVPAKNLPELIALMKRRNAEGAKLGFATSALGSADHLTGEKFAIASGVQMLVVPYKSTQPAITDVVGGHLPWGFFSFAAALPLVKSGALRALAISAERRSDLLPGVPTVSETLPGFVSTAWFGVWAPAGTPMEVRERIARDIRTAVGSADMATLMASNGLSPALSTPAEFADFIRREATRTADVIARANIKVE
ncbi:Bug family tripartite tricarboxylate transporter substrate binding protein [Ramlibacter sp.]|uniref:Bug family tripartite tricarboxylate transporter substrate binding protein n=1 Tax=Ramlibacter sp. TaxID=1917967 RepID=UPI003D09B0A7